MNSSNRSNRCCAERPDRHAGIALIAVLWLLAFLIVLAGTAVSLARMAALSVTRLERQAELELAADSAIRRTVLGLLESDPGLRWPIGGTRHWSFHGVETVVSVTDESGRVDVNSADAALLSAVLAANGIELEEAQNLAARIVDWRHADDSGRPLGTERPGDGMRSIGQRVRDGPFETPDEITLLSGFPDAALKLIDRAFTTYTGQVAVNARAAPDEVVAALKWADARQWGGRRWLNETESSAASHPGTPNAGRIVRINVLATSGEASVEREAVLRLTGNARAPTIVLAWH